MFYLAVWKAQGQKPGRITEGSALVNFLLIAMRSVGAHRAHGDQ
jgi:hypothetical protein